MSDIKRLEIFVGVWDLEAIFPGGSPIQGDVRSRAEFEWVLNGAFLVERSDGFAVFAPAEEGDRYTQHYFDSRGVVRLYEMTFDGRLWTKTREKPDFSPLDFKQRYTGTFAEDGNSIRGTWEICHEGETWQKDFDLNYIRAADSVIQT
jgi:hypothetical protein